MTQMVKIAFAKRNLHAFFLQGAFAFGGFVVSAEFSRKIDLPIGQVAIVFFRRWEFVSLGTVGSHHVPR